MDPKGLQLCPITLLTVFFSFSPSVEDFFLLSSGHFQLVVLAVVAPLCTWEEVITVTSHPVIFLLESPSKLFLTILFSNTIFINKQERLLGYI